MFPLLVFVDIVTTSIVISGRSLTFYNGILASPFLAFKKKKNILENITRTVVSVRGQ